MDTYLHKPWIAFVHRWYGQGDCVENFFDCNGVVRVARLKEKGTARSCPYAKISFSCYPILLSKELAVLRTEITGGCAGMFRHVRHTESMCVSRLRNPRVHFWTSNVKANRLAKRQASFDDDIGHGNQIIKLENNSGIR